MMNKLKKIAKETLITKEENKLFITDIGSNSREASKYTFAIDSKSKMDIYLTFLDYARMSEYESGREQIKSAFESNAKVEEKDAIYYANMDKVLTLKSLRANADEIVKSLNEDEVFIANINLKNVDNVQFFMFYLDNYVDKMYAESMASLSKKNVSDREKRTKMMEIGFLLDIKSKFEETIEVSSETKARKLVEASEIEEDEEE